jgi:hypothetical protein
MKSERMAQVARFLRSRHAPSQLCGATYPKRGVAGAPFQVLPSSFGQDNILPEWHLTRTTGSALIGHRPNSHYGPLYGTNLFIVAYNVAIYRQYNENV